MYQLSNSIERIQSIENELNNVCQSHFILLFILEFNSPIIYFFISLLDKINKFATSKNY